MVEAVKYTTTGIAELLEPQVEGTHNSRNVWITQCFWSVQLVFLRRQIACGHGARVVAPDQAIHVSFCQNKYIIIMIN